MLDRTTGQTGRIAPVKFLAPSAVSTGLSDAEVTLVVAAVAVAGSLLVAAIGAWVSLAGKRREERRRLYGESVRAARTWVEILYRVRRRRDGQDEKLVEIGHEAQEEITFYQGWIGSESAYMGKSYQCLVSAVKAATRDLITDAWNSPIRPSPGNAIDGDQHPDVQQQLDEFLKDVRSHTSAVPVRKIGVWWRNREKDAARNGD